MNHLYVITWLRRAIYLIFRTGFEHVALRESPSLVIS